ncbi:hypothetical protein ABFB09_07255 [Dehalogenimonas sp. THU2]|uniref:hypothetical protein n=1 Tax=Dehalogenimonas sp. THU2 TaxID=3151121 RepID=UPI0032182812
MERHILAGKAHTYIDSICAPPHRRTGSGGNRTTVEFFTKTIGQWGYATDTTPFPCLDHETGAVSLAREEHDFEVFISPFSLAADVEAHLVAISTVEELAGCECRDKILLLNGAIAAEQLMPKNFTFYNPEHHQQIYTLLEDKRPGRSTRSP